MGSLKAARRGFIRSSAWLKDATLFDIGGKPSRLTPYPKDVLSRTACSYRSAGPKGPKFSALGFINLN